MPLSPLSTSISRLPARSRASPLIAVFAGAWVSCAHSAESSEAQVVIQNFMFIPASLTVNAGATVIWTNQDEEPHTVLGDEHLFSSGALDTHQSFKFQFVKPGTYHFICTIHPRMVGTVVVR